MWKKNKIKPFICIIDIFNALYHADNLLITINLLNQKNKNFFVKHLIFYQSVTIKLTLINAKRVHLLSFCIFHEG